MGMTFDGPNKRIILTAGTTSLSVRDVWSRWVDWFLTAGDNSKYLPAFVSVGGDDIDLAAGTKIPIYAFLTNGWRVRPQEANHTLNVTDGILLVDGGGDPFVDTAGAYIVRVNYQQPVQAISFSTGGGGGVTPAQMWDFVLEGGYTAAQIQRLIAAAMAGTVTGMGSNAPVFRGIGGTRDRIIATVDDAGNRLSVTLDGTP